MKKVTAAFLAHVDAGKTTLSEAMLYETGEIRTLGRVDYGNTYLDSNDVERNRGITVFSKQAELKLKNTQVTLLDTPGHVDFSAEMERVLSVVDYAILLVSGVDGVQSNTETLWRLLAAREIPVFVFVNKMDIAIRDKEALMEELRERFGAGFVDFGRVANLSEGQQASAAAQGSGGAAQQGSAKHGSGGATPHGGSGQNRGAAQHGNSGENSGAAHSTSSMYVVTSDNKLQSAGKPSRATGDGTGKSASVSAGQSGQAGYGSAAPSCSNAAANGVVSTNAAAAAGGNAAGNSGKNAASNGATCAAAGNVGSSSAANGLAAAAPEMTTVISDEAFLDDISLAVPEFVDTILEGGDITVGDVAEAIRGRRIFPCMFGSALKVRGVRELMDCIDTFTIEPDYTEEFGAVVFKIMRDRNDERLTFMKLTGGELKARELLEGTSRDGEDWSEKVNQIRIYSGMKFRSVNSASAGDVCAVTGLTKTLPGDALGAAENDHEDSLEPFLSYVIEPIDNVDPHTLYLAMKKLEEEDPKLHITWNTETSEVGIRLMGEVQLEVITGMIKDRLGYDVRVGRASLVYRETIRGMVEGVGHFEPLRHYAEVHVLMEAGERGSGIVIDSILPEDVLARNWQRLILTHLYEREHLGVLTGSPITDIKITLAAGRAHDKHTNGGDFREATYRAVRNGLMKAESILLEPWFAFRVDLPQDYIGRIMTDVDLMQGSIAEIKQDGENAVITGRAPASKMLDYQAKITSFTSGRGRLSLQLDGYDTCPDQEAVIEAKHYDPTRDLENSPDSVFVSHSESDIVPWDKVEEYMHIPSVLKRGGNIRTAADEAYRLARAEAFRKTIASDEELRAIFERTYGSGGKAGETRSSFVRKNRRQAEAEKKARLDAIKEGIRASRTAEEQAEMDAINESMREKRSHKKAAPATREKQLILIDGYNLINFWDELRELSRRDMGAAREQLIDRMINYRGYMNCDMIVVFDAYRVPFGVGSEEEHFGVRVVYTMEDEPADIRIGRLASEYGKKREVRVVSSDGLVQQDALTHNAMRTSSLDFVLEYEDVVDEIRNVLRDS